MRSSISTTDNKTFTLSANPTMGTFATHKIRVTTGAMNDTKIKLEKDYSHATGFTTSTPCTVYDAQTCPIPFSTAVTLNNALSNGAQIIPIESGAAKGKILIVMGANASTSTNIFNPDTGIITSGPTLTGSVNITESSAYFFINSGIHSGKVLIIHGNGTTTSIYDPTANSMISGPNLTAAPAQTVNTFSITSGIHSGKVMIVLAGSTALTNLYDPLTNTFSAGPNVVPATPNPAQGSHNITITSGANAGKTLIFYGGANTNTSIYDPASNTFSAGPNLTPGITAGAQSFLLNSGPQSGNILTANGNGSNTSIINTSALNTSVGSNLVGNPINYQGSHGLFINSGTNSGKLWIISGNNNTYPYSTSSLYDLTTNTFSSGPNMISICPEASKTVFIETGIYANKYITFYGSKSITSFYDPIKNAIDPSSILPSSAGNGINKILLTAGSNSGKMLVINGGSNATSLFDFASGTFSGGATLTGVMGKSPGVFTISGGSQDGKTFIVHGGGLTTTSLYDPIANSFSSGPALSAAANNITSECTFKVPSGAQAGKYLIVHGNVSTSTSLYDPSNNTVSAGPVTGTAIGVGATCFPITSGPHSGKFLLVQGLAATGTRMYDPATNTFGAGPVLTMNTTNGTFAMPITSGANSGKTLIIIGSGTTTNLYDPTTHTFSVGPSLSASATGGAYLLLTVGTNKDKYLILHGITTSIYDPNTNTISAGLAISDGGILAFNITSGLFNQGVLLITGAGNLTNVVYP